jgi:mRNA-degrading endonuclease RelE of RelBE toxin-antitoxin system
MSETRWEVRAAAPARGQLDRLPVSLAAAVLETLGAIASDRRRRGTQLRFELEGCFSARRGPYRVIYRIDDDPSAAVSVLAVTNRGEVNRPG